MAPGHVDVQLKYVPGRVRSSRAPMSFQDQVSACQTSANQISANQISANQISDMTDLTGNPNIALTCDTCHVHLATHGPEQRCCLASLHNALWP